MKTAVVYWIRNKNHSNVLTEGYVGVARNLGKRISRHKRDAFFQKHQNKNLQKVLLTDDYTIDIIFSGLVEECYEQEHTLRSNYRIGWNIVPGGYGGSTNLGKKMSDDFRKKCSERMKGNSLAKGNNKSKTEEHKQKISKALKNKPKSIEQKQKQSEKMKGRKQSAESIEKRRLSALGKKRGPYKKKIDNVDL